VPEDDGAAAEWYRRAAEQGLADAPFQLATLYDAGRGLSRDTAQAAHWYRQAADQGLALAQHNLALMYLQGTAG
jgi:TPR repeat protein